MREKQYGEFSKMATGIWKDANNMQQVTAIAGTPAKAEIPATAGRQLAVGVEGKDSRDSSSSRTPASSRGEKKDASKSRDSISSRTPASSRGRRERCQQQQRFQHQQDAS